MAKRKRKRINPHKRLATQADIKKASKIAKDKAMIMSIAAPPMALHDLYGFGPKRLEKVLDRMLAMYADENSGCFSYEEANDWLWEYAGIEVESKR